MSGLARPAAPPRRRRGWIALLVVAVLFAGAFAGGEAIARGVIRERVEQAVRDAGIEVSGPIGVEIPGLVLPQLIGGRIDEATATAPGVTVEGVTADVTLDVHGVDVRASTAESAIAVATLDAGALEALLGRASAGSVWHDLGDAARIAIAEPHVEVSGALPVFGIPLPLALTLSPSADDGRVMLAPQRLTLGDWSIDRDDLDALPQGAPGALARPIPVCLAAALPSGIALDSVRVDDTRLLAGFRIDGAILNDPSLQRPGDCA